YSFSAAKIGRQCSTPESSPRYCFFDTCQRAYSAGGSTCCSVLPSAFLRAPSALGSRNNFPKKLVSSLTVTPGCAITSLEPAIACATSAERHCMPPGKEGITPNTHSTWPLRLTFHNPGPGKIPLTLTVSSVVMDAAGTGCARPGGAAVCALAHAQTSQTDKQIRRRMKQRPRIPSAVPFTRLHRRDQCVAELRALHLFRAFHHAREIVGDSLGRDRLVHRRE